MMLTKSLEPSVRYLNVKSSSGFYQLSCFWIKPPSAHKETWNKVLFPSGNFTFPYRHEFLLKRFVGQIFSSSFNQCLNCFQSIWKLLAFWLMFFSVFKIPVGYLHFKSFTKCSLFSWCYFELTIDYLSHANIEAKTCEIQPQAFEFVA